MYLTRLIEQWNIRDLGGLLREAPALVFYRLGEYQDLIGERVMAQLELRAESLKIPCLEIGEESRLTELRELLADTGKVFEGLEVERPLFLGVRCGDLLVEGSYFVPARVVYIDEFEDEVVPEWSGFSSTEYAVIEAFGEIFRWARREQAKATTDDGPRAARSILMTVLKKAITRAVSTL